MPQEKISALREPEAELGDFGRAPRAQEPIPDFDLTTTEGKRLRRRDFVDNKAILFSFGSLTCQMTPIANRVLKRLYDEFRAYLDFVTVYGREAHPEKAAGEMKITQSKMERARQLKGRDSLPWRVAVDDLRESFHTALGLQPNAAFLVNRDGIVVFRSLWSTDESGLRQALTAMRNGKLPEKTESTRKITSLRSAQDLFRERFLPEEHERLKSARSGRPVAAILLGLSAIGLGTALLRLSASPERRENT